MTRKILQRFFFTLVKLVAMLLLLLLLMEFAFCGLGDSDRHVWNLSSYDLVEGGGSGFDGMWLLLDERSSASLKVLGMVAASVLLAGYGWGVLAARFRRFKLGCVLKLPFSTVAMIPGFWLVVLVAIYSYSVWQRPGFADELKVTMGLDLLSWWHALVVAVPLAAAGSAMLLQSVSHAVSSEMSKSYVHGLYLGGHHSESIFYSHVFRGALPALIRAFDRPLPLVFGLLIGVEYAFRYRGMGSLFVESVNAANYVGILTSALWIIGIIAMVNWLVECALQFFPGEMNDG